jgi:hypothetical protein
MIHHIGLKNSCGVGGHCVTWALWAHVYSAAFVVLATVAGLLSRGASPNSLLGGIGIGTIYFIIFSFARLPGLVLGLVLWVLIVVARPRADSSWLSIGAFVALLSCMEIFSRLIILERQTLHASIDVFANPFLFMEWCGGTISFLLPRIFVRNLRPGAMVR